MIAYTLQLLLYIDHAHILNVYATTSALVYTPRDEESDNGVLQLGPLLCQLDEELGEESHVTQTVCSATPIQLIPLHVGGCMNKRKFLALLAVNHKVN